LLTKFLIQTLQLLLLFSLSGHYRVDRISAKPSSLLSHSLVRQLQNEIIDGFSAEHPSYQREHLFHEAQSTHHLMSHPHNSPHCLSNQSPSTQLHLSLSHFKSIHTSSIAGDGIASLASSTERETPPPTKYSNRPNPFVPLSQLSLPPTPFHFSPSTILQQIRYFLLFFTFYFHHHSIPGTIPSGPTEHNISVPLSRN
jgi:hypothetical protein